MEEDADAGEGAQEEEAPLPASFPALQVAALPFQHELTVRFDEIDRAGIVYFGRVFQYCHITYEELMSRAVGSLEDHFQQATWGMPLVHADADFSRPMRLGDRLTVSLEVERMGDRSVTFAYRIEGEDGEVRATAQLVHAFVDMKTFEGMAAPEPFVQSLAHLGLWPRD